MDSKYWGSFWNESFISRNHIMNIALLLFLWRKAVGKEHYGLAADGYIVELVREWIHLRNILTALIDHYIFVLFLRQGANYLCGLYIICAKRTRYIGILPPADEVCVICLTCEKEK